MSPSGRDLRKEDFLIRLGGLLAARAIRAWMSTLDYRIAFYDRSVDPALGVKRPTIYIFWHENILLPLYLRGRCQIAMLLSRHRDADVLAQVAHYSGFECVRGSTNRGGAKAVRELFAISRRRHLAITPDGPLGPRRRLTRGAIYLASKLQLPLVPMGFGYDRPWRAPSWDRFAVPKPFSRARGVIGPPLRIPPELDRAHIENCRERVERLTNCLTMEAGAWAESGRRKLNEVIVHPQAAPHQSSSTEHSDDGFAPTLPFPRRSSDAAVKVA